MAILTTAPRSGFLVFARRSLPAERGIHAACVALSFVAASLVALLDKNPYLVQLAPDFSGLIDNLWSSLFAALLVVLYFDSSRLTKNDKSSERRQPSTYIVHWFEKLSSVHGERISAKTNDDVLLKLIVYSILIVENYNRPGWMRKVENLVVRLPHTELTVGIAQVRSSRPLSDAASIDLAIDKIRNSLKAHNSSDGLNGVPKVPSGVLEDYNPSDDYREMVTEVFYDLIRLKPSAFGIASPL
ncbi:hypothetical protein PY310_04810 [Pseudarthrobacter sp. H3Y2-7]|uniref:hypothetical protein n=1 Tax=Pseudarthrobacter naphthalenicus TaxID=3031328 RepID=UPI0023AFCE93|nr:hypothetical protein [Pseudarthrobacter sp. H3Y2-7]MDE8667902.1 hypothetical protein [Pseudarthrobacter sp. H3Y2-7]